MDSSEIKERRETKAYPLFLEELRSVQNKFTDLRGQIRSIKAEQAEDLRMLSHRIKGSSGFFGYETLLVTADKLEKAFLKISEGDSSDINLDSLLQTFLDHIAEIFLEEA